MVDTTNTQQAQDAHLISAHDVVSERWRLHPTYVALCGVLVQTGLQGTDCPNQCECETSPAMAYCPGCVRAVLEQNGRAGVDGFAMLDQDRRLTGHNHG